MRRSPDGCFGLPLSDGCHVGWIEVEPGGGGPARQAGIQAYRQAGIQAHRQAGIQAGRQGEPEAVWDQIYHSILVPAPRCLARPSRPTSRTSFPSGQAERDGQGGAGRMSGRGGGASRLHALLSCLGLLLLVFWVATGSLDQGLHGLPPLQQPLDPLKEGQLIRQRILLHLKQLAAARHVDTPARRFLSLPATGCQETLDEEGRRAVALQFSSNLQSVLKSGWHFEQAELRRSSLRKPRSFRNSTLDVLKEDVTQSVEKAVQNCTESPDHCKFHLTVRSEDLGGSRDGDICVDLITWLQLNVTLKRRGLESRRFKRSPGRSCNVCHPHPFYVNLSDFASGFYPDNVGPDGLSELRYCVGDCRHLDCLDEPNHWLLLAIWMNKKDSSFPAPSCDAVDFADLTGTLVQPDNVSFPHNISNIVVTRCRCL